MLLARIDRWLRLIGHGAHHNGTEVVLHVASIQSHSLFSPLNIWHAFSPCPASLSSHNKTTDRLFRKIRQLTTLTSRSPRDDKSKYSEKSLGSCPLSLHILPTCTSSAATLSGHPRNFLLARTAAPSLIRKQSDDYRWALTL